VWGIRGPIAIRGFLVQTLVALLEIAQADPAFETITLEPSDVEEQFDFVWSGPAGSHAVQVKSTQNEFKKSVVEKWAEKMEAVRSGAKCRLVLVGNYETALQGIDHLGSIKIEKKNLDMRGLYERAAHGVGRFMDAQGMTAVTSRQHEDIAHSLVSRLELRSAERLVLSHREFIELFKEWVRTAPRGERKFDISRIDRYAPKDLIGREDETKLLADAWDRALRGEAKRPRVITFVALGGEGKTSVVSKWTAGLAADGWSGCDAAFAWSFYSQGTNEQSVASSDLFLREGLKFFGDPAMADSPAMAVDKAKRLATLVGERRGLLILDGLEPLQHAPSSPLKGELKDPAIAVLLKGLATRSDGLCVVTTRYSIPDLNNYRLTAPEIELLRLSTAAGVALLRKLGVRKESGSQTEFEKLVEDVKGHALTLHLLGTYLHDAHRGDIRRRDVIRLEEVNPEVQNGHAFRVMASYVEWFESDGEKGRQAIALLRLLGLFDRPAAVHCIAELKKPPVIPNLTEAIVGMSDTNQNIAFTRLKEANLLTVNEGEAGILLSLDAHPLLREFFAAKLSKEEPNAWRATHRRLYEHLCETATESTRVGELEFATQRYKHQPTLEDLQPLYQAIAHACQADMHQEACSKVYRDRILRRQEVYSTARLGAFGTDLGAIACFFEQPWSRVSTALHETTQSWLLGEAAFCLQALGRLAEALEPMRAGLPIELNRGDWSNAAIRHSNLSELELLLGHVLAAVKDAEMSVVYADRSTDPFHMMSKRTRYADSLNQSGQHSEAAARLREAEAMQAVRQPNYPLLYSLQGFFYCDVLLVTAERAAWRKLLLLDAKNETPDVEAITACRDVFKRATQTLQWLTQGRPDLLTIALDHLTLARCSLYGRILSSPDFSHSHTTPAITSAVDGLRRSGQQDDLPRGLLVRSVLRSLTGLRIGHESTKSDLDEAWEIAARGPMRLHLADIHLHRARLFFREKDYPWKGSAFVPAGTSAEQMTGWGAKDDLAAAEKLINECGYHRRDEELADAKKAIL
jgi:hypothetical protein